MTLKDKLKEFFSANNEIDVLYSTSDDRLFVKSDAAGSQSQKLGDNQVTPHYREDYVLSATDKLKAESKEQGAKGTGDAPVEDWTVKQLKDWLTGKDVEFGKKEKRDALIARVAERMAQDEEGSKQDAAGSKQEAEGSDANGTEETN